MRLAIVFYRYFCESSYKKAYGASVKLSEITRIRAQEEIKGALYTLAYIQTERHTNTNPFEVTLCELYFLVIACASFRLRRNRRRIIKKKKKTKRKLIIHLFDGCDYFDNVIISFVLRNFE